VPGLVEELCEYVNENFVAASALHLAAYVMWRVNWVHPFDDGNGRTARAASYLVLCVKLSSRLPGKPTIPDLIVDDKPSYWAALEAADAAWADNGRVDLGALEQLLEGLLATQLVSALEEAKGRPLA
jgi:Fic family protein